MLTGKHVRVRFQRDQVIPWYLDANDPQWPQLAEELLMVFRGAVGRARGEIEAEIDELFGSLPQPVIHQGFAKLIEDRCEFEMLPGQPPEQVRAVVFSAAAAARQQGCFERDAVLTAAGQQLGLEPAALEAGLFADLRSEQRLVRFDDTTPERLLERYNVALAQAVLLRSVAVEVLLRGEPPQRFRQLFRQIKFRRLLCEVEATGAETHCLKLDGPLSLFSATQKYGLQLALFLPTLLLCRSYIVNAELRWGAQRQPKRFSLTPSDGLVSHQSEVGSYVPPEVGMFVELFRKKVSDWDISEESEVIPLGRSFWVPDFRLIQRATGRVVLLDVLGFWRRSSVERHLELLRTHAGKRPFLVALGDQLRVDETELAELPTQVMRFRNLPLPEEVVRRAELLLAPEAPANPA